MNLSEGIQDSIETTKPRSRGDEPYQTLARAKQASKTPLTRG